MLSSEREKKSGFLLENVFYGENNPQGFETEETEVHWGDCVPLLGAPAQGAEPDRQGEQEWSGGESPWPLTPVEPGPHIHPTSPCQRN